MNRLEHERQRAKDRARWALETAKAYREDGLRYAKGASYSFFESDHRTSHRLWEEAMRAAREQISLAYYLRDDTEAGWLRSAVAKYKRRKT